MSSSARAEPQSQCADGSLPVLTAKACETCPFDGGAEVEQAINWRCVPSVFEIIADKRETGRNWGCHSANPGERRLCRGFVAACRELGLPYRGAPLLTYHDWYHGPSDGEGRVPSSSDHASQASVRNPNPSSLNKGEGR